MSEQKDIDEQLKKMSLPPCTHCDNTLYHGMNIKRSKCPGDKLFYAVYTYTDPKDYRHGLVLITCGRCGEGMYWCKAKEQWVNWEEWIKQYWETKNE